MVALITVDVSLASAFMTILAITISGLWFLALTEWDDFNPFNNNE